MKKRPQVVIVGAGHNGLIAACFCPGRQVDPAALGPIPDNVLLSAYTPQLDFLQRAHVFVAHGGVNSVMESLYYGVPGKRSCSLCKSGPP